MLNLIKHKKGKSKKERDREREEQVKMSSDNIPRQELERLEPRTWTVAGGAQAHIVTLISKLIHDDWNFYLSSFAFYRREIHSFIQLCSSLNEQSSHS